MTHIGSDYLGRWLELRWWRGTTEKKDRKKERKKERKIERKKEKTHKKEGVADNTAKEVRGSSSTGTLRFKSFSGRVQRNCRMTFISVRTQLLAGVEQQSRKPAFLEQCPERHYRCRRRSRTGAGAAAATAAAASARRRWWTEELGGTVRVGRLSSSWMRSAARWLRVSKYWNILIGNIVTVTNGGASAASLGGLRGGGSERRRGGGP